ncbi:MAG TPA: sulfur carrier protein ThiS [Sporichthya sp.]|nr:sulfur carrier protein ThiS [Sporichthya sp.]
MKEREPGGTVVVNGTAREFDAGTTVADLVEELAGNPNAKGVAAAMNGAVVPRGRWRLLELQDGDRVEILTAVQGG